MPPEQKAPVPVRDTTLGILVSLYLILLGFFAVLNSFSQDRVDKAGAVLESVNASFKAAERPGTEVVNLLDGGGEGAAEKALIDGLRQLFPKAVTFDGSFPAGGETSLKILLRKTDMFETDDHLSTTLQEAFESLGPLIGAFDSRGRVEITVALGVGERFPSPRPSGAQPVAWRQAGALSRHLGSIEGIARKFGVGYAVLEPDLVQLHFRILPGGRSRPTFTSGRGR